MQAKFPTSVWKQNTKKNILKTTDLPFYTWLVASVRTLLGKYNVATMVLLAHFRLITAILLKK